MRDLEFDIKARDGTAAAFDSARANARGFNHALDLTARGFNLAATAAKGFAVGFAVSSLAEFGSVVRRTISDAADLVDMADKVGVSTENIQRMVYGFGQAGVAAEDIDKILTQWAKRIGEAHTRGGQLAGIFRANNVALTDSEGRLRSSVELMRDYANLIAGAGSDQQRMALATLAFGDAGEAMVLALRDGAEGMDRLMKSTDAAGGVLEDKLLRRQAEIDEAFGRMWRNFETNAKSAILSAVTWLDDLRQGFREISDGYAAQQNAAELGAFAGGLAGTPRPARGDRLPSGVDRRIEAAFAGAAPEGNEAHLDTGATTLCTCWRVQRQDGQVFGFTDHDRPLTFGGVTHQPDSGFTASEAASTLGLSADSMEVQGALSSAAITEADIALGKWDNASVEIRRVNWSDTSQNVLLRKGTLGEIGRGDIAFTAEIRGLSHELGQQKGRTYSRVCDAVVGDGRCKVNLASAAFRATGTVIAQADGNAIRATGIASFASGWFARGVLTWTSGANAGTSADVSSHAGDALMLWERATQPIMPGDTFIVTAGCKRTFAECQAKFGNTLNFRGFPHIPGNDFALSTAKRSGINDGGSFFV